MAFDPRNGSRWPRAGASGGDASIGYYAAVRRLLFNAAATLSLALSIAAGGFWTVSLYERDDVTWHGL